MNLFISRPAQPSAMFPENDIAVDQEQEVKRNKHASSDVFATLNALVILCFAYLEKVRQR